MFFIKILHFNMSHLDFLRLEIRQKHVQPFFCMFFDKRDSNIFGYWIMLISNIYRIDNSFLRNMKQYNPLNTRIISLIRFSIINRGTQKCAIMKMFLYPSSKIFYSNIILRRSFQKTLGKE